MIGKKLAIKNAEISVISEKPFPRDKLIVGFMGSAGKEKDNNGDEFEPNGHHKERGELIGKIVAKEEAILSNGAAWGIPYYPMRGANQNDGYTLGISPYPNAQAHKQKSPIKHLDLILYTGIECDLDISFDFIQRDAINTLYPDVVISDGGRWGSLDECAQVLEQGRIYIPIRGTGGATDLLIYAIENKLIVKNHGAKVIIAEDTPESLEKSIKDGLAEAKRRRIAQGRTQNLFSHVVDELEKVMGVR